MKRYVDLRIELIEHQSEDYPFHEIIGVKRLDTDLSDTSTVDIAEGLSFSAFGERVLTEGIAEAITGNDYTVTS